MAKKDKPVDVAGLFNDAGGYGVKEPGGPPDRDPFTADGVDLYPW
jgi:hypothetical protein